MFHSCQLCTKECGADMYSKKSADMYSKKSAHMEQVIEDEILLTHDNPSTSSTL